jgi:hypothetical protein
LTANSLLIKSVNDCFRAASSADEQGIADDMAAFDSQLKKWDWQIKSYLTTMGAEIAQ